MIKIVQYGHCVTCLRPLYVAHDDRIALSEAIQRYAKPCTHGEKPHDRPPEDACATQKRFRHQ